MANENLRIPELPLADNTISTRGEVAIYDHESDTTDRSPIMQAIGGQRASFNYDITATYNTGDLVLSNRKVWESLVNSNTGNVPNEGVLWTEKPISAADGITDTPWAAGAFTYFGSKIVYNSTQYYLQVAPPFISEDILAEIAAGSWATSVESKTPISVAGGATTTLEKSGQFIIELHDIANYVLQDSTAVIDNSQIHSIKNVSEGIITISTQGSDTIEDETTQQLGVGDCITVYLEGTKYKVI